MVYILYIENQLHYHYVATNPSFYTCRTGNPHISSCKYWRDPKKYKNTNKKIYTCKSQIHCITIVSINLQFYFQVNKIPTLWGEASRNPSPAYYMFYLLANMANLAKVAHAKVPAAPLK